MRSDPAVLAAFQLATLAQQLQSMPPLAPDRDWLAASRSRLLKRFTSPRRGWTVLRGNASSAD